MSTPQIGQPMPRKPLRLWPGVAAVALQWLLWLIVPAVAPGVGMIATFAALACAPVVLVWWLFFSRAPWAERVGALALMVVGVVLTKRVVHPSIANGHMGLMLPLYAVPAMCLALVAWAVVTRRLPARPRRAALVASVLLACLAFTVIRTGGITGDGKPDLHWRWTETPEERLLARARDERTSPAPAAAAQEGAEAGALWPGFRGAQRDGVARGARIATDWSRHPPVELWRKPVGPGWSSFAVRGNLVYTQEQRGEDEVVSCYNLTTGEPVWRHKDAARFWESNAGAGPRGTPTLSGSRVYTLGATGIVNALDAATGAPLWSRNASADTGKGVPGWGFSSSPLVVDDVLVVAAAGVLVGYDITSGNPRWFGPKTGWGYSSPHLAIIDGVAQVLQVNGEGAISVAPADGRLLWKHAWPSDSIVQPALTADGDVLLGSGSGLGAEIGVRRLSIAQRDGAWAAEERWTSTGLKPYFNDFVVHKDHAYGFDGGQLACIDLKNGERRWEGGRYGSGQLVLLPEQDLLLVVSEEGELALVKAAPEQFAEAARFRAIRGKTWNHPVLAGDILLVRNAEEMAAFRLSPAGR